MGQIPQAGSKWRIPVVIACDSALQQRLCQAKAVEFSTNFSACAERDPAWSGVAGNPSSGFAAVDRDWRLETSGAGGLRR
jgi:hypothetical protein